MDTLLYILGLAAIAVVIVRSIIADQAPSRTPRPSATPGTPREPD